MEPATQNTQDSLVGIKYLTIFKAVENRREKDAGRRSVAAEAAGCKKHSREKIRVNYVEYVRALSTGSSILLHANKFFTSQFIILLDMPPDC